MSCRQNRAVPRSAGNTVLYIFVVFAALFAGTAFAQSTSDASRIPEGSEVVGAPMMLGPAVDTSQGATSLPAAGGAELSDQGADDLDDAAFDALFDGAEDVDDTYIPEDAQFVITDDGSPVDAGDAVYEVQNPASDQIQFIERPEDDLLIVEVVVGKDAVLDPGIIIYADEEGIVLPLSVMMDLFKFPINVDPAAGTASGWFVKKSNTFTLRPPYNSVNIAGEEKSIPPSSIENQYDDIYVKQELFEQWFPVRATLNFNELRLYIKALEPLPFQLKASRRARWDAAERQSRTPTGVKPEDVVRLPYRKYAPPIVNLNHNVFYNNNPTDHALTTSTTVQSQGDLFGMNLDARGAYRTDSSNGETEFDNFSFKFSKRDYDGKLLGPLKATGVEFGDVGTTSIPLAQGSQRGRGVVINNRPINYVRSSRGFVIEGDGPIGYDVEVYQDDRLLGFQTIGTDGRYAFDALTLRAGFNLFRVVLYGPSGETEERFERFFLGRSPVGAGQFMYEISALQSSTPLFEPDSQSIKQTPGTVSLLGEYGINEYASANATFYQGPLGQGTIRGVGAGLRLSALSSFFEFNTFQNEDNARSVGFNATGNLSPTVSWNASQNVHNNYDPDLRTNVRETSLGVFKRLSFKKLSNASIGLEYDETKDVNDVITKTYSNRVSTSFLGLNLSNNIEYTKRNTSDITNFQGELTARKRFGFGLVRGRMIYSLDKGDRGVDLVELQLQKRFNQKLTLNTSVQSTLGDDKRARVAANLDWQLEKFRLGLNASATDQDEYTAGVNLAYSFVPSTLGGGYRMSGSVSDSSTGKVALRPFLDVNGNGVLDGDETPIEGVEFTNRYRGVRAKSQEDGVAVLGGIAPNIPNRIEIDQTTLPDIYMVPQRKDFFVLGRLGLKGPIDFPMDKLGEISGVLYGMDPKTGELTPLENVEIYLLDETGEVIAEAYSEFDGFYLFPSLPMGSYEMFFPKSTSLDAYYSGQGTGPRFTLAIDQPELTAEDIVIADDRIDLLSSARETGIQPNAEERPKSLTEENGKEASLNASSVFDDKDEGFFALKTKQFLK